MKKVDSRTGIEVLDRAQCFTLLAREEIGRVALAHHGVAEVFPVNYALDGETIAFRTAAGTKLDAEGRSTVAFEVDRFDRDARSGWSVVVHGRLEEVTEHELLERMRALDIHPWAGGDRDHWLRLVPSAVSGRRVGDLDRDIA